MPQAKNGFLIEIEFPGLILENNDYLGIFPADLTGDGVIDSQDGFNAGNPDITLYGDTAGDTARRVQRNITTGNIALGAGGNEDNPTFGYQNRALNITDATAFPSATYGGTTSTAYYPDSRAEVLEVARKANVADQFMGAVGTTLSNEIGRASCRERV